MASVPRGANLGSQRGEVPVPKGANPGSQRGEVPASVLQRPSVPKTTKKVPRPTNF